MATIQYSADLLKDFDDLIRDFVTFMTLNLVHADKNLQDDCQKAMTGLIRNSLENSGKFVDFFEKPLLNHEKKNKDKLMKNLGNFITFFYQYLQYTEPIIKQCRPDIFSKRYSQLVDHFLRFRKKYAI